MSGTHQKGTLKIKRRGAGGGSAPAKGKAPAAGNPSFGTEQERSGSSNPAPGSPRHPEQRKAAEPFDIARLSVPQYDPGSVPLPPEISEAPEKIVTMWRRDLEIFRTLPGGTEVALGCALRAWMRSAGKEVAKLTPEELRSEFRKWRA
jgi:hypothetical protein